MKFQCIHAHFDDYEFTAGGTFEIARRALGDTFQAQVVVCTDGQAGHHFLTREETGKTRRREQEESARIGKYQFRALEFPDGGSPREGCVVKDSRLHAALWKVIRDFQPDYLFCPPVSTNPLAGVHPDHLAVAESVRNIAYMINVPHAFTPEYPADETQSQACKVPVIINVYDGYMAGANAFHFAVDVTEAFDAVAEMSWSHQSQIKEWLPWVGRHEMEPSSNLDEWKKELRDRFQRQQKEVGLPTDRYYEVFTATHWGIAPEADTLLKDIPGLAEDVSKLDLIRL